ncbi:hypothetical protein [Nonomuraea dietziae]|uniref:hypothetical protein n=1 Tax=Nonomuraea dietziae TaxID=65515 RepID=UPI0031E0E142
MKAKAREGRGSLGRGAARTPPALDRRVSPTGTAPRVHGDDHVVRLAAADGALAECHAPFPRCRWERRAWPPLSPRPRRAPVGVVVSSVSAVSRRASSTEQADRLQGRLTLRPGAHGSRAAGRNSGLPGAADEAGGQTYSAAADNRPAGAVAAPGRHMAAVVSASDRKAVDLMRAERRLAPLFALEAERSSRCRPQAGVLSPGDAGAVARRQDPRHRPAVTRPLTGGRPSGGAGHGLALTRTASATT